MVYNKIKPTKEGFMETDRSLKDLFKQKAVRLYKTVAFALTVFFIILGFTWTGNENLFYNSILMPVVGVLGYLVFKWKAIYKLPFLMLILDMLAFAFKLADIELIDALFWPMIYSVFVAVGVMIAFLLHFALKKEGAK